MPEAEPFLIFTRKLAELDLRYMVSGSIAAIYYGEPRLTNDVDIVLVLPRGDAPRFASAFPIETFYCPPVEIIKQEQGRTERGHFNLIHHDSGFKADIYLAGDDDLHAWGLAHARTVSLGSDRVRLAPPEYVILRKLEYYEEGKSQKHLRDVARMLVGLGDAWSRDDLLALVRRHDLGDAWRAALAFDD